MGATMMVRMITSSTIRLPTARGFFKSFRMPSRKNVEEGRITSCCRFFFLGGRLKPGEVKLHAQRILFG